MKTEKIISGAQEVLVSAYSRFPMVIDHGEDVYLYDIEGKKYLDFAAGIGVMALGYSNEEYKTALKDQIDKITHTSNLFYTKPMTEAAELFIKESKMDRVFFTNSGAEAIEGALKVAKKYSYKNGESTKHEFIAMRKSFHGRTLGSLSVTHNPKYRYPFKPLIPGVKFADFNDLDSVKEQINSHTCAIIMEPIQGEGGIHMATKEFMKGVRKLCDKHKILLIFDEVQCGMGRTGEMFAWQGYNVKPDILVTAKGLGAGVPVGAFAMMQNVADRSIVPGDHGTTYGGNPFVGTAVKKVFEIYEKENILDHVKEVGEYLTQKLNELVEKYDFIEKRRGKGLIQGLVFKDPVSGIVLKAQEEGLIIISAGEKVLRFLPPLVIEKSHVDEMIEKIENCFS